MKKKVRSPWLVALIAASFSFFTLICSVCFSDIVQIQDRLPLLENICKELFNNNIFNSYYEETKIFFIETLNQNLKDKYSCPNYLIPCVLFVISVFKQLGLIRGKLEKNIKELYEPLKKEKLNICIFTYRFNIIFFVLNVAAFSCWWIRLDFPPMFFCFCGCVLQYLIGLYFNYKYNLWNESCFDD